MNGQREMENILRNLGDINVARIFLIIVVALLLAKAVDIFFPWLAERFTGRLRLYILPTASVLRLLILIGAIGAVLPLVLNLTFRNSLALIGAASFALGFALKDYVSSIVAGIVAMYERPYRPG